MIGSYNADSIVVLRGLEAVRRRPAMYIGSTGSDGVFNLVVEVLQNAIDEALGGHARTIVVTASDQGEWTVADDGRGIPVDPFGPAGRPAAEIVATVLHSGSKFEAGVYDRPGGLHGVGLACVNALASELTLRIVRGGESWFGRFRKGEIVEPIGSEGAAKAGAMDHGTTVYFRPDPEIFGSARADVDSIATWLQAQAWLLPGLTVVLRRPEGEAKWHSRAGLPDFAKWIAGGAEPVHAEPITIQGEAAGIDVEVALQWTRAYTEQVRPFVNNVHTAQGGTHVDGLRAALARAVAHYATSHHLLDPGESLAGYDVYEGLVAVLAVRLREPEFEGQTKSLLTSAAATDAVRQVVAKGLAAYLGANPGDAAAIVGRAVEAARARAASRRASERARYQRVDIQIDKEVYRQQFGIRSKNWHDSARWITDATLLGLHGGSCAADEGATVLDVCCGSGVVGASFKGRVKKVIGLDLTPEMIALAKTRLDEVVQGDVYEIPFPAASFEVVCNREVLHLLPQPERPVAEVFRVLKPGGQFIVGQLVPFGPVDAPWMFRILKKKQPLFFNNFLDEDMRALLLAAGFVDLTMREYLQWEDIDTWINTWETAPLQRHQIRDLYHHAPAEVRAVHPFEISPTGAIRDCWRWCVYSCFKPASG